MNRYWDAPRQIVEAVQWAAQFDPQVSGCLQDPDDNNAELHAIAWHYLSRQEDPDNLIHLIRRALTKFPVQEGYHRVPSLEPAEERGIKLLLEAWGKGPMAMSDSE